MFNITYGKKREVYRNEDSIPYGTVLYQYPAFPPKARYTQYTLAGLLTYSIAQQPSHSFFFRNSGLSNAGQPVRRSQLRG